MRIDSTFTCDQYILTSRARTPQQILNIKGFKENASAEQYCESLNVRISKKMFPKTWDTTCVDTLQTTI